MQIKQITIVGTGLIGGSFGLALKERGFTGRIVGCDKPPLLARARQMGAIDSEQPELRQAVDGSDVVLLATPVGGILDLIEQIGPVLPKHVLVTDVGSTKREIVSRAQAVFGSAAATRFLAGHPMAGKEHSGIENADPDLFQNAVWLFTPAQGQDLKQPSGSVAAYMSLVESTGARVLVMDAERHDKLCAWVSHLPQMLATTLAAALEDEFGDDEALKAVGGRALGEMTRIAASPYSMWRDIALTNTENIGQALSKLEQRLGHLRENLRTRVLQEEFEKGNRFKRH
jgi:prephenate dehydrogenase